jgi:hypothetical protein
MNFAGIIASVVCGGLAGASVSIFFNRLFHWRALRTQFYPVLNNIWSAYLIRMENPQGRYWTLIVGNNPSQEDVAFVGQRSLFISDLVKFNELKEARILRKQLLDNMMQGSHAKGLPTTIDLQPEFNAISACHKKLHEKLKL